MCKTLFSDPVPCARDEYQCKNYQCIRQSFYCDGEIDCEDETDEPPTCRKWVLLRRGGGGGGGGGGGFGGGRGVWLGLGEGGITEGGAVYPTIILL